MTIKPPRITPFLWFDHQAEPAVRFYTSIFPNSKILSVSRYNEASARVSGRSAGSVMTVDFQLDGQDFSAINGGPHFRFTEAISFVVNCHSQKEVDHYWEKLSESGDEDAQQCGWLKDKYGISWQVIPTALLDYLHDPDAGRSSRAMAAMLKMKRIDIAALQRAADETAA